MADFRAVFGQNPKFQALSPDAQALVEARFNAMSPEAQVLVGQRVLQQRATPPAPPPGYLSEFGRLMGESFGALDPEDPTNPGVPGLRVLTAPFMAARKFAQTPNEETATELGMTIGPLGMRPRPLGLNPFGGRAAPPVPLEQPTVAPPPKPQLALPAIGETSPASYGERRVFVAGPQEVAQVRETTPLPGPTTPPGRGPLLEAAKRSQGTPQPYVPEAPPPPPVGPRPPETGLNAVAARLERELRGEWELPPEETIGQALGHEPPTPPPPLGGVPRYPERPLEAGGTGLTAQKAMEHATSRELDLGEVGRRRAAERYGPPPAPLAMTKPWEPYMPDTAPGKSVISREEPATRLYEPPPTREAVPVRNPEEWTRRFAPPSPTGELTAPSTTPRAGAAATPLFDPAVPATKSRLTAFTERIPWFKTIRDGLPRDAALLKIAPDHPLVTETDRFHTNLATDVLQRGEQPWLRAIRQIGADDWKRAEQQVVDAMRAGASPEQALADIPPQLAEYARARAVKFVRAQEARNMLGLEDISESKFPYFPRRVAEDADRMIRIFRRSGSASQNLRSSVGSYAQKRYFDTALEGEAAGYAYEDPRMSALFREHVDDQLIRTAEFVNALQQKGMLYSSKEAARANGIQNPILVRDFIPGGREWWTPNREFGLFIRHQFQSPASTFGTLVHYANALFRNPNLLNPVPHFTKNMLYKYGLVPGDLPYVIPKMLEYFRNTNPQQRALYEQYMPFNQSDITWNPRTWFNKTGSTADQLMRDQMRMIRPDVLESAISGLGMLNRPSSKAVFTRLDPALKYAKWSRYVERGLDPQSAANHTQVDLIRYGTRSDIIDGWKAIPMNMFVPWRFGTVASLIKQLGQGPMPAMKAAAFIGTVDYIREAYYRQTGRWFHLPIDYVEAPIMAALESRDPLAVPKMAATLALFGPGGEYSGTALSQMLDALRTNDYSQVDWNRARHLIWGLGQIYDMGQEANAWLQDGDPGHLTAILTTGALGAHESLSRQPRRWLSGLSESLPGMQRSSLVQEAERLQQLADAKQMKTAETTAAHHNQQLWGMSPQDAQMARLRRRAGVP